MTESVPVVMTAIIAIGAISIVGCVLGYDGIMLGGAMALIGGLGGYVTREVVQAYQNRQS